MSKVIPEKVNDYRVYPNGSTDLRGVADLQLPSFDAMTESITGAGIIGEYEAANYGHFGSMKLTLNWRMITGELTEFLKPEALQLDCRIVNQEYAVAAANHAFTPQRVLVKGQVIKNDLGKVAKGSGYEGSTEIEVTYIKLEREGKTIVELDKMNYIYVVDGIDYMKKIREGLGL
ncbi:phage major tail tube protein [Cytobacillus sp. IB215665]|uniref:phage major tail tube protein n=1 Tax=Cytobacillus sp. IB215665 TaxID=3097357 RepID=UPI002A109D8F|nr:phage major tail tube protein [Cytobacillus sp. IB215665]MDX8367783.1 phage major tail tube protein [Cytobacillus sp. IB215665]